MTKEKEKLFYDNLDLVETAKGYFRRYNLAFNTLDDLYQVGCIGLMNGVEHGNADSPYFRTYLKKSIWNAILREIESKKKFSTFEILPCAEYDDNGEDITTGIPKEALSEIVPNSAGLGYSYLIEYLTEQAKNAEKKVQKGVKYLILNEVYGYKLCEIADLYKEANRKSVAAYVSTAKAYFRQDADLERLFREVIL